MAALVPTIQPGQIAGATDLVLIHDPRNPRSCACGWYRFYSSRCGHAYRRQPMKCGATPTASGRETAFCRKPALTHNVHAYVVDDYCSTECRQVFEGAAAQQAAAVQRGGHGGGQAHGAGHGHGHGHGNGQGHGHGNGQGHGHGRGQVQGGGQGHGRGRGHGGGQGHEGNAGGHGRGRGQGRGA